jgi:uncharacterized protein (TIGR03083 family)
VAGRSAPQSDALHIHLDPDVALAPYARHRRRFAEEVADLDHDALAARSRCSEWSVADVLRHINDVDSWMDAIWNGTPLPFTSFDPNVTPRESVEAQRGVPDADVRDRFVAATPARAAAISESSAERWGLPSLSPLGAVPWWMSALHAFWDSWLHERDALLPIGIEPPVLDDEARPVVTYSVGLAATLVPGRLETSMAGVRVRVGDGPPDVAPEGGSDLHHTEIAVVIDALCGRASFDSAITGSDGAAIEQLGSLARLLNG